jgi:group I intron endonuclease
VYQIKNLLNNKLYVGSTCTSFWRRFYSHYCKLTSNKHHSVHLQNAWNKYGAENFQFQIIEECVKDKNTVLNREQFYIDNFKPEYNECPIARSILGRKMKDKTKKILSEQRIGRKNYSYDFTEYALYNPKNGLIFGTKNEFKLKYNFGYSSSIVICNNKGRSYKGWICLGIKNDIKNKSLEELDNLYIERMKFIHKNRRSKIIFNFKNDYTSEIFSGNIHEFLEKYNLKLKSIRKICCKNNNSRNSLFGWKCINPI